MSAGLPAPLAEVLVRVSEAVEAEGKQVRAEFLRADGPRGSGAKAPLDTEIELRLRNVLQGLVHCTFIGEETGMSPGPLATHRWLVDPHDGTRDFLKGNRGSSISVALLRGSIPVLGVVHIPLSPDQGSETIAWAEGCGPIRRNGIEVRVDLSRERLRSGTTVCATKSSELRPEIFSRAVSPARYIAMTSIAHRLARVAAGDSVAAISIHAVNEYDIAAGAALIRAAGGVLLDAQGREIVLTGAAGAAVSGCFGGAPEAVEALARFEWSATQNEAKKPLRAASGFPKISDEGRIFRAQGCLLGQLIGDSLGSLVEFRSAAGIAHAYPGGVRDLADGGAWSTIAGQPTDDGEMALALARSILKEGRFDAGAACAAYREWLASGPFDCDRCTHRGISGRPNQESEGNGSLMRVSPIGIWAAGDPEQAAAAARADSALTHPHPVCMEACAGYAAAIAAGIATGDRSKMAEAALQHAAGPAREVIASAVGGERPKAFETDRGWVLIALQNAFYRLFHASALEDGVIATVAAGGDTGSNGAIAGALLGAAHGRNAIPLRWMLPVLACRALTEAGALRPRPMCYWPDDVLELAEALCARQPVGTVRLP